MATEKKKRAPAAKRNEESVLRPEHVRETPLTYGDYAAMPDDGSRYELVNGVLESMSPGATTLHQLISHRLQYKLTQTCDLEYIILGASLSE